MSEDINLGNITEAVNNKADIDLQNTDLAQADYVIERGGTVILGTGYGNQAGWNKGEDQV